MRRFAIALLAAGAVAGASTLAYAEERGTTPGHEMQEKGSVKGSPGASGYAPGHEMKERGTTGMNRDRDRDDRTFKKGGGDHDRDDPRSKKIDKD